MRITINTMSDNVRELLSSMNVDIHYPEFGGFVFNVDYVGVADYNNRDAIKVTPVIINDKELMVTECMYSNQCLLQTITEYNMEKEARDEEAREMYAEMSSVL